MECYNCGISVMKKPLRRTGEIGKEPNFMCDECMEIIYPDKLKADRLKETPPEKFLKKIFYENVE